MSEQAITQVKPQPISVMPTTSSHGILQRCSNGVECEECHKKREGTLQRAAVNASPTNGVPSIVHDVLRSPGQSLDRGTRTFMESRFNHDFSGVRVHTDGRAAESARSVNAVAYTVGRNVVFGAGQYSPNTISGKRLLAHELTHVVQQNSVIQTKNISLDSESIGNTAEQEAETVATQVTRGDTIAVPHSISALPFQRLQRQTKQDTHAGVFELTKHDPLGKPNFVPQAQYDVHLEFLPYDIVDCKQIALTQGVVDRTGGILAHPSTAEKTRALTAKEGTEGFSIDRLSGRTSPLYGTTNAGVPTATNPIAHFGSHTPLNQPDSAWIEDSPGFERGRTPGLTMSLRFETCAICNSGADKNAYYGCVSWGFNIDKHDKFTELPLTRISKGTPSSDFTAAARKWNAQTVPVATTPLPVPGHVTRNVDMTRSELETEITNLEIRLRGLTPGHADIPQITFELRVLKDIKDAIEDNEGQGYLTPFVSSIQKVVGATQNGTWNYDTVRRIKIWQASHGQIADGRVTRATLKAMGISDLGDYEPPTKKSKVA